MNDQPLLTFGKFEQKNDAQELAKLLTSNGIAHELEEVVLEFDPLFGTNKVNAEYRVSIQPQDLEKATALLVGSSSVIPQQAENEYYLFAFTDEELFEVLRQRDEWSKFDFELAQDILKERGKGVDEQSLIAFKEERMEELSKPAEYSRTWIYGGYLFALLGGLAGLLIGWHISSFKKKLPDGSGVYAYSAADRKHGVRIMVIAVLTLVIFIVLKIMGTLNG